MHLFSLYNYTAKNRLLKIKQEVKKKLRRAALVASTGITNELRYDNIGHFPSYHTKKNRCRLKQCKNGYTTMTCMKCKVWLCLTAKKNCFFDYHRHT